MRSMQASNRRLIEQYLDNVVIHVRTSGYNQVWSDWRDLDYTPDYNKFYWIQSGEGWLKIGNEEYYPRPGEWFLMPEGVQQSYSYINDNRYTKYWCHFSAKVGGINLFDLVRVPLSIIPGNDIAATRLFEELLSHEHHPQLATPLLRKKCILELIAYYIQHCDVNQIHVLNTQTTDTLQQIMDYIERHYHENISINTLAGISHLHPNYFIRWFKKHFGASPIHYVNKRRIAETQKLLATTQLTLAEIGERVGVTDAAYLSKLFKSMTGYSPTAYRHMTTDESGASQ